MSIDLPVSKSIANRLLMLQAIHGDPLMEVTSDMPDDVRLLRDTLEKIHTNRAQKKSLLNQLPQTYDLGNCGTAMRFLIAYCATLKGQCFILDGSKRLRQRPIEQEVACLHQLGALIQYLGQEGHLPVYIYGAKLNRFARPIKLNYPLSSQMVSALMMVGIPVTTNSRSPYISMTKKLMEAYSLSTSSWSLEKDWSAAAFWYEYVALHGGEVEMEGLRKDSVQGDKHVAQLFRRLGVDTTYTDQGVRIARTRTISLWPSVVDFSSYPDLYPALKMTYFQLGKPLIALGTKTLRLKESDRLEAFSSARLLGARPISSQSDHRIAMALLAGDLSTDDTACIAKSYPHFVEHLSMVNAAFTVDFTTIIPRRGINDENKGKKHALHRLIAAATTPYVWLQDDDVLSPLTVHRQPSTVNPLHPSPLTLPEADLYILPLRMQGGDSLLERLQKAEYAAIQEVTMRTAKRGKAVMCSGANLLVNRERWLESWDDLKEQIPSGDDMFLLESFRRRGLRILPLDREDMTATITAETSWRSFLGQRMRWAGKAPHYTDRLIRRYGAFVLLINLLQLICPIVLLVKFPVEYRLIKKRDPEVSFITALILEIVYPLYILLCILGGLFRSNW